MGCGRTNLSKPKSQGLKNFNDKKINFQQEETIFKNFLDKNPYISKDISLLKYSEIEDYLKTKEELMRTHQIGRKLVSRGIIRTKSRSKFLNMHLKSNTLEILYKIMDKINQTDSDIKIIKKIFRITNSFPKNAVNSKAIFMNFGNIENNDSSSSSSSTNTTNTNNDSIIYESELLTLIDQVKFCLDTNLEHLSIRIHTSLLTIGKLFLDLSELIEYSLHLQSLTFEIHHTETNTNNNNSNTTKFNLNIIEPILSSIRSNTNILNIVIHCNNCEGFISEYLQESFTFLINDDVLSFGLSGIKIDEPAMDSLLERILDVKKMRLFGFECAESVSFKDKHKVLLKIAENIKESNSLEMIYLTGFEDCTEDSKMNMSNAIRKLGYINNVIFDVPLKEILNKFYED